MMAMLATWGGTLNVAYMDGPDALHPKSAVKALLEVESCGKVMAVKGQFVGPLQMGRAYLKDAGATREVAMTSLGSVMIWRKVQQRYRVRRPGEPLMVIAIFHKGGPGTLTTWRRIVRRQLSRRAASHKLYMEAAVAAAKIHNIPGMADFVRRFEAANEGRGWWCGKDNKWME